MKHNERLMRMLSYRCKLELCLAVTFIFFIIEVVLSFVPANETVVSFNKYLSCLILLWAYIVAGISGKGFFYPFTLYLVSYTVFVYSRLIMDVMGLCSFDEGGFHSNVFYFTDAVRHKIVIVVSCTTLSLTAGALCAFLKRQKTVAPVCQKAAFSAIMRKAGLFLMAASFIPFLVGRIRIMMEIALNGYGFGMMDGGLNDSQSMSEGIFMSVSSKFFYMSVFLYLATYPKGKLYRCVLIIFLIASILELGSGSRSYTVLNIFLFMTYLGCRGLKLSFKKVCLLGGMVVAFLYFSFAFVAVRNSSIADINMKDTEAFSFVAKTFFWQQGITLDVVIGETIRSEKQLKGSEWSIFSSFHAMLFSSIISDLLGIRMYNMGVQNKDKAEKSWYLGGKLMYYIDPKAYFNGAGTGSSIVAEAYCCGGLFGTLFWPFFFMYMFIRAWERYLKVPHVFFLFLFGLSIWYATPRCETFAFLVRMFYAFLWLSALRFALKLCSLPKSSPAMKISNA